MVDAYTDTCKICNFSCENFSLKFSLNKNFPLPLHSQIETGYFLCHNESE